MTFKPSISIMKSPVSPVEKVVTSCGAGHSSGLKIKKKLREDLAEHKEV